MLIHNCTGNIPKYIKNMQVLFLGGWWLSFSSFFLYKGKSTLEMEMRPKLLLRDTADVSAGLGHGRMGSLVWIQHQLLQRRYWRPPELGNSQLLLRVKYMNKNQVADEKTACVVQKLVPWMHKGEETEQKYLLLRQLQGKVQSYKPYVSAVIMATQNPHFGWFLQCNSLTQSKLEHVQLHLKSAFHATDPKIEEDRHKTSPAASEVCYAAVVEKKSAQWIVMICTFCILKGDFNIYVCAFWFPEMSESRINGETGRVVSLKVRQNLIFTATLIFFSAI